MCTYMDKKKSEAVEKIETAKCEVEATKRKAEAAKRRAEAAKREADAARKKREGVAITLSLFGSKEPGKLCCSDIEDFTKIAFNVIDWEDSNASTIRKGDIENLRKSSPQFGVLEEGNGRKIYACFIDSKGMVILKKWVVPLYSGVFQDKEKLIPLIEKHFPLIPIHRNKEK